MMAGKMKLRNFLILAVIGAAVVFGLAGAGLASLFHGSSSSVPVSAPVAVVPAPSVPAPPAAPAAPAAPSIPVDSARPWDAFLIGKAGSAISGDKVKDASGSTSYKVNLYQDSGSSTINRAKVDIDRDDKWDEKWTFAADGITRQVAPADDEQYAETWLWDGSGWRRR